MPTPHIQAAFNKLLDQCQRFRFPGKYYVYDAKPLAVFYPDSDKFLATMSLIYLVSLLDEALEDHIRTNALGPASTSYQRIELLDRLGLLSNAPRLHEIRKLRNQCAHDPEKFIAWQDFECSFNDTKHELSQLGIVA